MTTTLLTVDDQTALQRLIVEADFLGWTLRQLLDELRARLQRADQVRLHRYMRPDVALLARLLEGP